MECEFCRSHLATKYTLALHQETNKTCLGKQKEKGFQFVCECSKTFTIKQRFERHQKTCISMKKEMDSLRVQTKEIEQLQEENRELKYQLLNANNETIRLKEENQELKQKLDSQSQNNLSVMKDCVTKAIEKPSIQINQTLIQNLAENTVTSEIIQKICEEKATEKTIMRGLAGVANLLRQDLVLNKEGKYIVCFSDLSRRTLRYKKQGTIITDPGAGRFIDMISKGIICPLKKIMLQFDFDGRDPEDGEQCARGWDDIYAIKNPQKTKMFLKGLRIPTKEQCMSAPIPVPLPPSSVPPL